MMRIEHRHPVYYLECDRCNMQSPHALNKKDTLHLAYKNDWYIEIRWNGYIHTTYHLCPWCQDDEVKSK